MVRRGLLEPLPDDLMDDVRAIGLGKELGIPARAVMHQPAHWIKSAAIAIHARNIAQERAARSQAKGKGS